MPQITDEQFNEYMAAKQVADFIAPIYNDPKTSEKAKALIKEYYPNLEIPGFDAQRYVDQRFAERDKQAAEQQESRRRQHEDRVWKEQRTKAKEQFGLTDEGLAEVERLMKERKIADYEVAASYLAAKSPKSSEPTSDDVYWNHYSKAPDYEEIAKDPEAWGRKQLIAAFRADEQQARQRPGM